jgi:hypothetical protein
MNDCDNHPATCDCAYHENYRAAEASHGDREPTLPTDPEARKTIPLATGCIDYFPDALAAVAELSRIGNEQHNPGKPLHWDRSKSGDESDALMRHFLERGTFDTDGVRHSAKVAWRALAMLQKEIEADREPEGAWRELQKVQEDHEKKEYLFNQLASIQESVAWNQRHRIGARLDPLANFSGRIRTTPEDIDRLNND